MSEPGIDLNGAGIDMYPGRTDALVSALGAAQGALDEGWEITFGQIETLDGQLGRGPMGRAFAAQYNPAETQIVDGMTTVKGHVDELATEGHTAVQDYVRTDQLLAEQYGI